MAPRNHWERKIIYARRIKALLGSGVAVVAVSAFIGGYELAGGDLEAGSTTFHDMRALPPDSFTELVATEAPEIQQLALRLGTPRAAYQFVRDSVRYDPSLPLFPVQETLASGRGSCLSKAVLLASLYRALGMGHEQVRVVAGQTGFEDGPMEHAWLEIESEGRCLQQDPTTLLGSFKFDEFPGTSFSRKYIRRELFCFNDQGLAIVSLSNRFRGGTDPHQQLVEAMRQGALASELRPDSGH